MFTALLYTVLCAAICYRIASNYGRDRILAALLGAVFGLFAIIGYFMVGPAQPKRSQ